MNTATTPPTPFDADEALAFVQVRKLKNFYFHLAQYVLVVTVLAAINLWTRPQHLWVGWVAFGWGMGVLLHAIRVFERFNPLGAEWEKKQVEKRLGRKI